MPHRTVMEGDTVFVRALVLTAASGTFQVRVDDGQHVLSVWVPSAECAKAEDIARLRSHRVNGMLAPHEPLIVR